MSFWTDKLAGKDTSNTQPLAAVIAWWAQESAAPQNPPEQAPPQQPSLTVRRPREASEGSCPACFSGNYMAASRSVAPRCFDCGYPIQHSTSGMVVSKNTPFGQPVRQAESPGFHPETIVARGL